MQLEEFDVYNESCTISMASNGREEIDLQDSSDDNCSMDVDDASFPACSSESSINNGNIDKTRKIPKKPGFFHPVEENDSLGSQLNEQMDDTDFRSVFFNTSNSPTCGKYHLCLFFLQHVLRIFCSVKYYGSCRVLGYL